MKISIVTITYNAARVLQRTLDSVNSQTYSDIEHLIIDGASQDSTVAMSEAYRQQISYDVVIQSEPDQGLYDAMNKGLRLATGDYIIFMNAGDTFHETTTLENVAKVAAVNVAVLYGDTNVVDQEGRFLRKRHLSAPEQLTWRSFRQGMLVCHQAFYVRLDIARNIPYDLQFRHSADVDWCIRVMKEAERRHLTLVRVPGVVADFLDGGDSTQNHRASLKERFSVMHRHYGLLTTLTMHVWFVVRAISSKLFSR
jgi:glycosyltransferase involved in cell wall biosynthesis